MFTVDIVGMIAFRGKLGYVQYMPAKPVKRGVKVWIRCDSDSGYMQQFDVYLGAPKEKDQAKKQAKPKHGVYFEIVDKLTIPIRNRKHRLFFDNLYTSIPLLLHLYNYQIYATGTLRTNRKYVPAQIKQIDEKQWERGKHLTLQDRLFPPLTVTAWKDTKLVSFASTAAQPLILTRCMRRVGSKLTPVNQPHCSKLYSANYGAVDLFDALRSVYKVGRFSKKPWKYLFFFLINASVVNAWILYKEANRRRLGRHKYRQADFRLELVEQLIGKFTSRKRPASKQATSQNVNVNVPRDQHVNIHMGHKRPRRCFAHRKFQPNGAARYETVFGCSVCQVPLCKSCHAPFHANNN